MEIKTGDIITDGTVTWVVRKQDHPQIGTILDWENAGEPGDGWLKCNGATYNSVDYPLLAAIRDPANTGTFVVPDRRGYVPRGLDEGAGVDTDGGTRVVGSKQRDDFKSHYHRLVDIRKWNGGGNDNGGANGNPGAYSYTTSAGGTETRGKNVATKYYICYA